jgi:glycine oxidase
MTDCIIVGGGLIGMLTARELKQAGADVILLERGKLGGESTWAGGGILSPLYPWRYDDAVNALAKHSQRVYAEIAQQLQDETGIDPEYTQSGLLVLDNDTGKAAAWADKWDMRLHILKATAALNDCEPVLNAKFQSALWMPDISQMRNPRLIKALKASLDYRKIPYVENSEVIKLDIKNNRVNGVITHEKSYKADKVIIAGGAWSHKIIGKIARPPEIEPVKGQMILFKGEPGLLKTIVLSNEHYLIPRRDGRILAGSTLERTEFKKELTQNARVDLRTAAIDIVPELERLPIEHHWAGLRPGSEQGIPYICEHPDINSLFINSGHYRNGVILGAASACLLADIVMNKPGSQLDYDYGFIAKH